MKTMRKNKAMRLWVIFLLIASLVFVPVSGKDEARADGGVMIGWVTGNGIIFGATQANVYSIEYLLGRRSEWLPSDYVGHFITGFAEGVIRALSLKYNDVPSKIMFLVVDAESPEGAIGDLVGSIIRDTLDFVRHPGDITNWSELKTRMETVKDELSLAIQGLAEGMDELGNGNSNPVVFYPILADLSAVELIA